MRAFRWRAAWVLLVALAGSQAGHLLIYRLRFGAMAGPLQESGVHAYFPDLAQSAASLVGGALIAALGIIGVARLLNGGAAARRVRTVSLMDLLAVLFTLQFAVFLTQETLEAVAEGLGPDPAMLFWGMAGQLAVAAPAAAALSALLSRLEAAVTALLTRAPRAWSPHTPHVLIDLPTAPGGNLPPQLRPGRLGSRAPPTSRTTSAW